MDLAYVLKLQQTRNGQASTEDTGTSPTYLTNDEVSAIMSHSDAIATTAFPVWVETLETPANPINCWLLLPRKIVISQT